MLRATFAVEAVLGADTEKIKTVGTIFPRANLHISIPQLSFQEDTIVNLSVAFRETWTGRRLSPSTGVGIEIRRAHVLGQ